MRVTLKIKIGKEVSNLLVIFDKDIIIFSDKAITYNKTRSYASWQRWFKKSVIVCAVLRSYLAQRSL
ncbi:hypothetical protein KKR94_p00320 (plasmid) [Klebsiella pneumoniae]|nr:hypothetical protein KKR94_p00320 [Klebsiella pneumoniae]